LVVIVHRLLTIVVHGLLIVVHRLLIVVHRLLIVVHGLRRGLLLLTRLTLKRNTLLKFFLADFRILRPNNALTGLITRFRSLTAVLQVHDEIKDELQALENDKNKIDGITIQSAPNNSSQGNGKTFKGILDGTRQPTPEVEVSVRELTTAIFTFVTNPVEHVEGAGDTTASEGEHPTVFGGPSLGVLPQSDALENRDDEGCSDTDVDDRGDVVVDETHGFHGAFGARRNGGDAGHLDAASGIRFRLIRGGIGEVTGEKFSVHVPVSAIRERSDVQNIFTV